MIVPNTLYHIYNLGNNKQSIFYTDENYIYFLTKVRNKLLPHLDILAYCLMPNHFHFLAQVKENISVHKYNESFRTMLSSYTQAINNQENRTGSLFRQNTKLKPIDNYDHGVVCFHYIHQNPLIAKLVSKMEDWEFSSFRDYCGMRDGTLPNKKLALELFNLPEDVQEFKELSDTLIEPELESKIL